MKTIEQIKDEYLSIINDKVVRCTKNMEELMNDEKNDEANLEKVKINIYGIFRTLVDASEKKVMANRKLDDEKKADAFCNEILDYFQKIPSNWKVNMQKAKEHNDIITSVIEENKLAVANDLEMLFKRINAI